MVGCKGGRREGGKESMKALRADGCLHGCCVSHCSGVTGATTATASMRHVTMHVCVDAQGPSRRVQCIHDVFCVCCCVVCVCPLSLPLSLPLFLFSCVYVLSPPLACGRPVCAPLRRAQGVSGHLNRVSCAVCLVCVTTTISTLHLTTISLLLPLAIFSLVFRVGSLCWGRGRHGRGSP